MILNRDTAIYVATQPGGSPPPTPADNSAELRALWTGANLYLAIFVRDDVIVNDSSDVWRDDEIELAFVGAWDGDPAGGDTHQYTVNADGRITDFGNPANPVSIQAAAVRVPGGWNVEVRIPATSLFGLNAPLTAGKTVAFDLGLHDDDDGGNWDSTHDLGWRQHLQPCWRPAAPGGRRRADAGACGHANSDGNEDVDADPHPYADGHCD